MLKDIIHTCEQRNIMAESTIKKLPLGNILAESWRYCRIHGQTNLLFAAVAYAVGALALFSWKSLFFWPVLVLIYVLWGSFFRYYLGRKPYFDIGALFNSLIPSTKIVLLSVVICTLLIVLPIIPLFWDISPEFNERYMHFLQGDLEQNEGMLVVFANLMFIVISPFIAYRPFLAWISALAGRSGSLRFAWDKTRGNYAEFLLIAVITNLSIMAARWVVWNLGGNDYVTLVFVAPVVIYFNVAAAKAYEFFFLDVE